MLNPKRLLTGKGGVSRNIGLKKSAERKTPGRPSIKLEIQQIIKRMATENFIWGAPRIYSELLKLGYTEKQVSQRTISRYLKKVTNVPGKMVWPNVLSFQFEMIC